MSWENRYDALMSNDPGFRYMQVSDLIDVNNHGGDEEISATAPASPSYYARHGFDATYALRSRGPAPEIGLPAFPPNWRDAPDVISEASSASVADEPDAISSSRGFWSRRRVRHNVIA